jgi:hypothetical protein
MNLTFVTDDMFAAGGIFAPKPIKAARTMRLIELRYEFIEQNPEVADYMSIADVDAEVEDQLDAEGFEKTDWTAQEVEEQRTAWTAQNMLEAGAYYDSQKAQLMSASQFGKFGDMIGD